jgi:hypothetical protein
MAELGTGPLRGPLRKRDSHLWRRHPQDYYIEPKWCSERLFEMERFRGSILDPACGSGRIVRSAVAAGYTTFGSDIVSRHPDFPVSDFMDEVRECDNIVSNPPFSIAEKFVARALHFAPGKVAMLLPANWIQGDKRSRWLEKTPLRRILFITPRPSMPPGPVIEAGGKPGSGTTDYAWFIWDRDHIGSPQIGWLRREAPKLRLV